MRRLLWIAPLSIILIALAGCHHGFRATRTASQALDHMPASAIHVDTHNGAVEVVASSDHSEVAIEARLTCGGATQAEADQRLQQARIDASRDTSRVLWIRPVFPGGRRGGDGASFSVRMPDAGNVMIETSNGRVEVSGTRGRVAIDTSNGSVDLIDHEGPAVIDTSNGAVHVVHTAGSMEIETSNGRVLVEDHEGGLWIDTSNGVVTVTGQTGKTTIDTSNGSITLSLRPDAAGPVELGTSNSSISLTVGSAFAGAVTLRTSNGSISIHDPTGAIRAQQISKNHAKLTIGEGGSSSRLWTSNGRIVLTVAP